MSFSTKKRVMITGANTGIGFETAKQLASAGSSVVMVCRSRQRGEDAAAAVRKEVPDADITLHTADLASAASILQLVREAEAAYSSLSVLINNAGGIFFSPMKTEDGLEYTFGLNHMGYFRLTLGLLPLLEAGAPARIINVSSEAHRAARLDFTDLQSERRYKPFRAYGQSKLANLLFTREAARRFADLGITTAALHPGFINSSFASRSAQTPSAAVFGLLARTFGKTPAKGAETPVHLASADEITNGAYYTRKKVQSPSKAALGQDDAARLWDISRELAWPVSP